MLLNNLYASLSQPNLARSFEKSQEEEKKQPEPNVDIDFEYEEIKKSNDRFLDIFAQASDVIVSNKITSKTEYNGFAIHLLSIVFLIVWLVWSFFPQKWFNYIGIYYYPDRWWQLVIPSHVLMAMIYIYIGLALYNIEVKTCDLKDVRTIVDEHAVITKDSDQYLWKSTNGVWDLPITTVSKVLYSDYDGYVPS